MNIRKIASLFLLAASLLAAAPAPARAEPPRLNYAQLTDLADSLVKMDGAERAYENVALGGGQTATRILRVPYDLRTPVRVALANDLSKVKVGLAAYEQKRQLALNTVSPGAPEKVQSDPALLAKFATAWNVATAETVPVDLELVTLDDLNLEKNKDLPGTTISGLAPIIKPK